MNKFHPFFVIGTVGLIITAVLHIFLALGLSIPAVHITFFVIYPVFIALILIGFGLTLKDQKRSAN